MKKELSAAQREELLGVLKTRFEKNMNRQKGLEWAMEYLLGKIKLSLVELVDTKRDNFTDTERLNYFLDQTGAGEFSRKD